MRGPHSQLRADRGQPAARPDHARPVRVWHRHHRKPDQDRNFNFTVKATDGNLTSTLAYQITITVQGPPDQLLCNSRR